MTRIAPDVLVGDIVRLAARATPRSLAATLGDEELTFGELDARSNQVARALSARGIGVGDRVAWWGETSLDAMPIFDALARIGAAFMPVNARLGVDEAVEVLEYAKPHLLIADEAHGALLDGRDPAPLEHRVLFFRDQDITRAEHVAFARHFGALEDHPVAGSPVKLTAETDPGAVHAAVDVEAAKGAWRVEVDSANREVQVATQ